jgi:hypothetical protein
VARGLDRLDVELEITQAAGYPIGGSPHVASMRAVGAHAGDSQQLEQVALEILAMLGEVIINWSHMHSP